MSQAPQDDNILKLHEVEHGYKLHVASDRTENTVPDFSNSMHSTAAAGYLQAVRTLSAKRWESILTACDAAATATDEAAAHSELDILDGARIRKNRLGISCPVRYVAQYSCL
ncbi:hypothetical protein K438DRAFT_1784150 [Mycena galopus ATCC 62051]|nr:hypothetical protein K438DRAFT_1784150 [Mycena galopus ATCC 62051]